MQSRCSEAPPVPHGGSAALREYLTEYYGRVLTRTQDLERKACCADSTLKRFPEIAKLIPAEVKERNYGCGCSIPSDDLKGLTVLDLGSGAGLDAFLVSHLVGPSGAVHGIDMTPAQLEIARRNTPQVMKGFGYPRTNVFFHEGYIETADAIPDASIDLVISDCVINLSPRKDQVLATIHRVLRSGGELYISDIFADRRVPERLRSNEKLVAECLGGALYEHDAFDLFKEVGFRDPRVVERSRVEEDVDGTAVRFDSLTIRAFKLDRPLDTRCEDYGQSATYRGNCAVQPARFVFDDHHAFESRRPTPVCRNTARMLAETRLGRYFSVTPEVEHFGLFPCGPTPGSDMPAAAPCC